MSEFLIWFSPVFIFYVWLTARLLKTLHEFVPAAVFSALFSFLVSVIYFTITQFFIFGYTETKDFPAGSPTDKSTTRTVSRHIDKSVITCKRFNTRYPDTFSKGKFNSPKKADSCIIYVPLKQKETP